ncbi:WGR domain-containing protein [Leptospira mayottensis]|uniref:WGR domain protein n=2 Tax=Leptospira mayottensis TaxID=1137606 RepID=A0AA87SY63_9LEPT|nr:WGR domain-containing protein [Leptospira mayottensis]AXR60270.1 WGR domain-containing protein [Leptospira mayottensis]AXR64055.1 WGR domain-containing protein [Leptospira mayottensis]AZQ03311.1 WGR domain-containing protein [Leptospira mayottensis 200901116]EKS01520.1 WGR domain protein [Leptospira mayottensis 200901122]TGN10856.1 WGR domain-containing protein [Leptospira mayottensis]
MTYYLTYQDDKSDKFWNIEVSGTSFTVTYGKTGTSGQTQTKDFDSEEKCLKEAKKLLSEKLKKGYVEDWKTYHGLIYRLLGSKDLASVAKLCEQAKPLIQSNSQKAELETLTGRYFYELGEFQKAREHYLMAIDANPMNYSSYDHYTILLNHEKDYAEAMSMYGKMITLFPSFKTFPTYGIATLYSKLNDPEKAVAWLKTFLEERKSYHLFNHDDFKDIKNSTVYKALFKKYFFEIEDENYSPEDIPESEMNYFVIERENNDSHPLLSYYDGISFFYRFKGKNFIAPSDFKLKLKLGAPIPKKYTLVDHHSLPEPVVSQRIKKIIDQLPVCNINFIPATIDTQQETFSNYYVLHVATIQCLDEKKSALTIHPSGQIFEVDSIVLDKTILKKIPFERRAIFKMSYGCDYYIIHESIVSEIQKISPKGIRFISLSEYTSSSAFE